MLALANVMYLLADELAGLRGWSLPGALVLTSAFQCGFFWHNNPPVLFSTAMPFSPHQNVQRARRSGPRLVAELQHGARGRGAQVAIY
jgi:hypothetical protein